MTRRATNCGWSSESFRNFAAEPYEMVEKYAAVSQQMVKLTTQAWYPFAKLVRNTLRHGTIEFNPYLSDRLPIAWRRRSVTENEAGQSLETIFDYEDAYWLLEDMAAFVRDCLD